MHYQTLQMKKIFQYSPMIHNANEGIPFDDSSFDAVYAHMFFNMRFGDEKLEYLFLEVKRGMK